MLALWLPAGNLHVDDLRRALATVGAVFKRYDVYLIGRGAVVIAGGDGKISYARLAGFFTQEDAASDGMWAELSTGSANPAAAMLRDAGFTDPMDLLTRFVGSKEDLEGLTAGARPYDAWRPSRPPAMALDLAEPARPAAVLALAQYRALGTERLLGRLQFDGQAQKMVALHGFDAIYADRTARTLRDLGVTSPERRVELLAFLTGPRARLDLLAPDQTDREVRIAVALSAIGLRQSGAAVLKNAIKSGRDTFEVNLKLADIEEAQAEKAEALKHLRRALELKPDSAPVRARIVALLLSTGQGAEAAGVLEEMVKTEPDNVATLLELGYVYAKLKRYEDAARTAEQVLRIEPNNADAQSLLTLSRQAAPAEEAPNPKGSGGGT